jgi:hypothetical protein
MKKITILFAFLIAFGYSGYAQVSAYSFSQSSGTYSENTAGATAIASVLADTNLSTAQPIGFSFTYDGVAYTQFKMSSNGFISFNITGTSSVTTNDLSAANATSRPIIAPLWDDLDGRSTGSAANFELTGTAGSQVLTVEWRNWEWNWNSGTIPVISFQVKLYEATGVIEFVYRQDAGAIVTGSASIGIGSATGSGAGSYLNVTSIAAPAVSSTTSIININTKPITGQVFRFTPPTPCTGAPVAGSVAPAMQTLLVGQTPAALVGSGYTSGVSGLTFQWQESDDNGVADAWANAVGGTGVTTASYTPPAFTVTRYYRLVVTCTPSAMSANTASVVLNACGSFAVPSLEDFTTYVPGCWQEADNGDLTAGPATFGTSGWIADGFGNVGTTGAFRYEVFTTGANDWILSPLYTIPVTGYELKFDAAATQWGSINAPTTAWEADDFVEVLVSTGTANWTVLYTFNNTNVPSNTGTPTIIDLDAYAGMDVRFAFRAFEGATNGSADIDFSVDNFEIRMTPACIAPTTLAVANVTATSVDLSWVDPSMTQFDFEYAIQVAGTGVPAGAGTAIADVSVIGETVDVNSNPLTANTAYEFYVRADCGAGGFSTWAGPFNFTTLCVNFVAPWTYDVETAATTTNSSVADCWNSSPSVTTASYRWDVDGAGSTPSANTGPSGAYSGNNYYYTEATSGATGAIAYLTPTSIDVTTLTTPYLKFYYHMYGATIGTLEVETYDGAVWTSIWSLSGQQQTAGADAWLSAGIDVSTYAVANVVTFRFKATKGTSFTGDISLDNISVIEAPTCIAPTTLAATNITAGSVDLSWVDPSGTQFDFEYAIQAAGTGVPAGAGTAITATSVIGETVDVNTNPLTGNTAYEFYVRADCGGGSFSTWVGPINFSTSIEVICGTPVNTTYCYDDNDATTWVFTSNDGSPLRITFNAGLIESCCDDVLIYDGISNAGTLLYQGNNGGNLTGLTFYSTSDSIYIEIDSDGTVSCVGGSASASTWDFTVVCATCVNPTATYTIVPDCASSQFSINVDVTTLGTATSLSISDGVTTLPMITATGIQTFGPYANGVSTSITLTNEQDASCFISSGVLASTCPPANDVCATPTVLTPGGVFTDNPVVGTNVGTTDSAETTSACGIYSGGDVWYQVTVPASGNITIETATNGTTFDTVLAVFSGTCGSLTEVDCSDDATGGVYSLVSLTAMTPGEVLLVNVFEYGNNNFGTFQVSAYDASLSSNSFDTNAFLAYPNPVKDVLNLEYNSEISSVRVMNLLGQEVISRNINANATQVDMSQLSAGAYIVNVIVGDAVKTIKVVKQ